MIRIPVRTPSRPYNVLLGSGLLARAGEHLEKLVGGHRAYVVMAPPVRRRWGKILLQSLRDAGVQAIFGPGTNLVDAAGTVLQLLGHNLPPEGLEEAAE